MIERGEIQDPNYSVDAQGNAHYLFGRKKNGVPTGERTTRTFKRKTTAQAKASADEKNSDNESENENEEDEDEDEDEDNAVEETPSPKPTKRTFRKREKEEVRHNPSKVQKRVSPPQDPSPQPSPRKSDQRARKRQAIFPDENFLYTFAIMFPLFAP